MPCLRTSRTLAREVASPLGSRSGSPLVNLANQAATKLENKAAEQARRHDRPGQPTPPRSGFQPRPRVVRKDGEHGAVLIGEFLRVAAAQGDLSALSRFLELGYDLGAPEGGVDSKAAWIRRGFPKPSVDATDESGYTALMKAAANGHLGCVDHLIAKGADVNAQTKSLMTALHWVAINDHTPCAESLIKAGAETSLVNMCGETALDYANEREKKDIVFLLENAPAFRDQLAAAAAHAGEVEERAAAERSFHAAASQGDLAALVGFLEQGVDVNAADDGGYTALLKAAASNHLSCVDHLLAKGADVNVQTESRMTALQLTVAINNPALCCESLIKAGADTSLKNEDGCTALDYAKENNNAAAIQLLEDNATTVAEISPFRSPLPAPPRRQRGRVAPAEAAAEKSSEKSPGVSPVDQQMKWLAGELEVQEFDASEVASSPDGTLERSASPR